MRIRTISATALCLVALMFAPAAADQRGGPPAGRGAPPATHTPHATTTSGRHTTTTTTNPIAAKISAHPQQAARIQPLLPQGMTLATASSGFRNQGQFIAALHVSRNLNIPFADLKSKMTGPHPMSLGRAIQALRPSANSTLAVRRAHKQATSDLR
jgi:hypothetical protein